MRSWWAIAVQMGRLSHMALSHLLSSWGRACNQGLQARRTVLCPLSLGFFGVCVSFLTVPGSMWNLSSPTRDLSCGPCSGSVSPNHWITREALLSFLSFPFLAIYLYTCRHLCGGDGKLICQQESAHIYSTVSEKHQSGPYLPRTSHWILNCLSLWTRIPWLKLLLSYTHHIKHHFKNFLNV